MAKKTCNFECYKNGTCPYSDCITDDITDTERAEQDRRDRVYQTYGKVAPARQQRKTRGRVI